MSKVTISLNEGERSPYFVLVLETLYAIHEKKNHDYAANDNPFSNFEIAAKQVFGVVSARNVCRVINVLIAIKKARLRELRTKTPLNESILDTMIDIHCYRTIKLAYLLKWEGLTEFTV